MPLIVYGKVTAQTITLYKALTFVPGDDGFGTFSQTNQGGTVESCPAIAGLGRWGALPKAMGGVLTITETTKNAIANGTHMSNGNFVDASNAFERGATAVYRFGIDATGTHAFAEPLAA